MDVTIKNVKEEDWRTFKAEAAARGLKTGEYFSKIINKSSYAKSGNWRKLLLRESTLDEEDIKSIEEARKEFRKNFKIRF